MCDGAGCLHIEDIVPAAQSDVEGRDVVVVDAADPGRHLDSAGQAGRIDGGDARVLMFALKGDEEDVADLIDLDVARVGLRVVGVVRVKDWIERGANVIGRCIPRNGSRRLAEHGQGEGAAGRIDGQRLDVSEVRARCPLAGRRDRHLDRLVGEVDEARDRQSVRTVAGLGPHDFRHVDPGHGADEGDGIGDGVGFAVSGLPPQFCHG